LVPPRAAAAIPPSHDPSALLTEAGRRLRWFALAGDVAGRGCGSAAADAPAIDAVGRLRVWRHRYPPDAKAAGTATDGSVTEPAASSLPAPASSSSASSLSELWARPPAHLTALLSVRQTAALSPAQRLLWDGPATPMSRAATAEGSEAIDGTLAAALGTEAPLTAPSGALDTQRRKRMQQAATRAAITSSTAAAGGADARRKRERSPELGDDGNAASEDCDAAPTVADAGAPPPLLWRHRACG
jgi:hypothetical protein